MPPQVGSWGPTTKGLRGQLLRQGQPLGLAQGTPPRWHWGPTARALRGQLLARTRLPNASTTSEAERLCCRTGGDQKKNKCNGGSKSPENQPTNLQKYFFYFFFRRYYWPPLPQPSLLFSFAWAYLLLLAFLRLLFGFWTSTATTKSLVFFGSTYGMLPAVLTALIAAMSSASGAKLHMHKGVS